MLGCFFRLVNIKNDIFLDFMRFFLYLSNFLKEFNRIYKQKVVFLIKSGKKQQKRHINSMHLLIRFSIRKFEHLKVKVEVLLLKHTLILHVHKLQE